MAAVSLAKSASAASTSPRDSNTASRGPASAARPSAPWGPLATRASTAGDGPGDGPDAALEGADAGEGPDDALEGADAGEGPGDGDAPDGALPAGASGVCATNSDARGLRPSRAPAPPVRTSAIARADSVC